MSEFLTIAAKPFRKAMVKKPSYEELEQRIKELEKYALAQRQVERDLRVFKIAVESSINVIGITDLEEKLTYVNDSCVKMWGYNGKDETLGRLLPESTRFTEI